MCSSDPGQLRSLGVSADWSRERFTMDEGLSKAVLTAFTKLYDDGLIYRGKYMVNWCPKSQSAVADLEVENKEVDGKLWHFRYLLTDGTGFVDVATRSEEHTSELQSLTNLVCRLLLEKKKKHTHTPPPPPPPPHPPTPTYSCFFPPHLH